MILRRSILRPDDSSSDNFSLGYLFARKILRRIILRRKVLHSEYSSPDNSSLEKNPWRWKILRRMILRSDDSLPESYRFFSLGRKILRRIILCAWRILCGIISLEKKTLEAKNSSCGLFFGVIIRRKVLRRKGRISDTIKFIIKK
jgi:hypothetical protein